MQCFGQDRFGGDDRAGPGFQYRHAVGMAAFAAVHQRNEGAGIEQQLMRHYAGA